MFSLLINSIFLGKYFNTANSVELIGLAIESVPVKYCLHNVFSPAPGLISWQVLTTICDLRQKKPRVPAILAVMKQQNEVNKILYEQLVFAISWGASLLVVFRTPPSFKTISVLPTILSFAIRILSAFLDRAVYCIFVHVLNWIAGLCESLCKSNLDQLQL